jgi:osmotically-inducible protein OsmY
MKIANLATALSLAVLLGCATNNRDRGIAANSQDTASLAPTSNRDQTRVYGDIAPPVPPNTSPEDAKLGEEIRELLMQNKKLAPPPSNVIATAHNGVVTLQGRIATRTGQQELREQIAQLPGVTRVQDELKPLSKR